MSSRAMAAWRRQQPGPSTRLVVAEGSLGIGTAGGACGMYHGEQQAPLSRVVGQFMASAPMGFNVRYGSWPFRSL
jgi:hypothetical protein